MYFYLKLIKFNRVKSLLRADVNLTSKEKKYVAHRLVFEVTLPV